MMELDEAIKHCHERAEENRKKADEWYAGGCSFAQVEGNDCLECAKEHEQLAGWLTELKERREADRWIPVSERLPEEYGGYLVMCGLYPKHCKDCQVLTCPHRK